MTMQKVVQKKSPNTQWTSYGPRAAKTNDYIKDRVRQDEILAHSGQTSV